jgi:integrase
LSIDASAGCARGPSRSPSFGCARSSSSTRRWTARRCRTRRQGGKLDDLRPKKCEELYREIVKTCAVDTHRNALAEAKTFGAWIATNPLAEVTGVGQRNRGKKQLRIDEARKLVDLCLRKANEGDEAAVGVLTAFLLGLRASEVTDRVVRDLDDNGRLLWIEFGKTRRARRTLEVPALLRPYLLALVKGRAPDAQLISRTISRHSGKKRDRYWLAHHVERLCTDAGVPVVCTQSLRGLHASVATEAGATSHVVASALGHSSPAVTHAHYIDGDTARRTRTRRVIGTVAPDPALRVVGDAPAAVRAATPEVVRPSGSVTDRALREVGDEPAIAATATRSPPRAATLRASSNAAVPALDVVGDEPTGAANTTSTAPSKPTRRGSGVAAEPALRVVRGEPDNAGATASEPTSAGDYVGNGQ